MVFRYYGEKKLEPSDRIILTKDGNKHSLTIKATLLDEAGIYNVKAVNHMGSLTASAKLKVIGE